MFAKSLVRIGLGGLVLVMALTACTAQPTATPTASPTSDPKPTYAVVATQAVGTAFADLTLNAPTATAVPPTDTPQPTATTGPTNTPEPSATPTRVFIPWTHTPSATVAAYGCAVQSVSPATSTNLSVDKDFDGVWTIKNTGTETWSSGNVDFRFIDGTKLHTGGDLVDLNSNVAPNGTYTVTIDMHTPTGDGTYTTEWALYRSEGYICEFALTINVVK